MSYDDAREDEQREIPESLATNMVVSKLATAGLAPEIIAVSLGIPVVHVRSVIQIHSGLTPQEQELAEDVRTLASMAVKQAARILQWGPTEQKLRIITSLLGHTARLIGTGDGAGSSEMRDRLEALFVMNRTVPVAQTVVTDSHVIDVQSDGVNITSASVQPAPPIPEGEIPVRNPPLVPPAPAPPTFPQPVIPPMPPNDPRKNLAAAFEALLGSTDDQNEVAGTPQVRY